MSTFFISDLHLGHAKILEFSREQRQGSNIDEHDEWIINSWNSVITKRDLVWVLGDVVMRQEHLWKVARLNGRKKLILGNHDLLSSNVYTLYFDEIYGMHKYKGYWLTHCPIHPSEFRKCRANIHGHIHNNFITEGKHHKDSRYLNVCVEALNGFPISLDELNKRFKVNNRGEREGGQDE